MHLAIMIVVGGGAMLVLKGFISLGALIGFFAILLNIEHSVSLISVELPNIFKATGGMRRIDELLQEKPQTSGQQDTRTVGSLTSKLCFENVSFSYNNGALHLNQVNLSIRRGSPWPLSGLVAQARAQY